MALTGYFSQILLDSLKDPYTLLVVIKPRAPPLPPAGGIGHSRCAPGQVRARPVLAPCLGTRTSHLRVGSFQKFLTLLHCVLWMWTQRYLWAASSFVPRCGTWAVSAVNRGYHAIGKCEFKALLGLKSAGQTTISFNRLFNSAIISTSACDLALSA